MSIFKGKVEEIVVDTKSVHDPGHIVSVIGLERADLIFYLAKILEKRHTEEGFRNVLLIDNSDSKDLFGPVSNYNVDAEEITTGRITFIKDNIFDEELFEHFSFVIIYQGMDIDKEILDKSDVVILQTDYNIINHQMIKEKLNGYDGQLQIIYRDWMTKKIKESSIEKDLNISVEQVEMRGVIKANLTDNELYLNFIHNGNQRFKKDISELFMENLHYLAEKITGANEKTIDSVIKLVK